MPFFLGMLGDPFLQTPADCKESHLNIQMRIVQVGKLDRVGCPLFGLEARGLCMDSENVGMPTVGPAGSLSKPYNICSS